jgi:peptidoglycan/xylan/chitin deacetylase (PgdA/CDA1 family)
VSRAWAGFRHMLASRGWRRGFYRAWLIWRRFGLTRRGMERNLHCLRAVLEQHGARATLFVPATVLHDHRASLEAFFTHTFEWGIHSDDHTDLSRLPREEQTRRIGRAIRLFEAAGVPFAGFRAPYLKTSAATLPALAATGRFLYDSSSCLLWDDVADIADIAPPAAGSHALEFYRPGLRSLQPCRVEREEGLLRIPVSLPDDDILVDRDRRTPDAVYATWSAILERSHREGEIFVLQLHPERACELAGVLSRLLQRARELSPPVWIATLGEVAEREGWPPPCQSAFCVTGDLDAMAVSDFLKRLRAW